MATTTTSTGSAGSSIPTTQQTQAQWDQNAAQAWQTYQAQLKMDREQQAIAFASNVESKGNQMLMACIQNIR